MARNEEANRYQQSACGKKKKDYFMCLNDLVKNALTPHNCHSGLSGILLFKCVTKTADSGQAGMTTFCKLVKMEKQ